VQIRQLEENIGVKLLDRNTRTAKLTRIGQQLAPVIERVLRDIEAVLHHAREMAAGVRGTVNVAALPSVCFHDTAALSQKMLAMVKNGEVDFGIGSFTDAESRIQVAPLFTDHMKIVLARDSPLAKKRVIQLKQLVELPLILMERDSSVRMLVDRAFESIGQYPTPATRSHQQNRGGTKSGGRIISRGCEFLKVLVAGCKDVGVR